MTRLACGALALSLLPTLTACGGSRSAAATTTPAPTASVTAGEGVTVVQQTCQATDICGDGIDNDCNGYIDEGCGFQSGQIQITLAWNTRADMDLHVTDPAGETINFSHRQTASGGALDVDARGDCGRGEEAYTVENVFWSTPQPPPGRYTVVVHNYSQCNVPGNTTATLSISVGGQVIGSYNVTLTEDEHQLVAQFDLA